MSTAAVVIGVRDTGSLTPLDGALTDAQEFADWASDQGMNVKLLTDSAGKLRINNILDAVEPIVEARTYHKLIVFFAGHGYLLAPQTELWLLSDAPGRAGEAVNVALSRDHARYCGIPHVLFVSDACRSGGTNHRHRSVSGTPIFPTPASYDQDGAIDMFYAARPGDPAREYPSDSEATNNRAGVFTECLLHALNGGAPQIVEAAEPNVGYPFVVRSHPLKQHLSRTVPLRAEEISLNKPQAPEVRVESHPPLFFAGLNQPPAVPPEIDSEPLPSTPENDSAAFAERVRAAALSFDPTETISEVPDSAAALDFEADLLQFTSQPGREAFESMTGFTIWGAVRQVTIGQGITHDLFDEDTSAGPARHVRVHDSSCPNASILIEFEDGTGTVLAVKPHFIGTVQLAGDRVANVNYLPSRSSPLYHEEELDELGPSLQRRRAYVAAASRRGVFRVEDDSGDEDQNADQAAHYLRMLKRFDPTLGIYAAYAYHEAGQIRKIRSVLNYMQGDPLPVPFDVALLARQDSWPSTAPFCPMLTQGWALLALRPELAAPLRELRAHLLPALWTTLSAPGVDWVRERLLSGELE